MMSRSRRPLMLVLLCMLAVAGCRAVPPPPATATPALPERPTQTPAATSTLAPTLTPAATAAADPTSAVEPLPEGWHVETDSQLSVALPPGWRIVRLSSADARSAYESFRQLDRELAGILSGPERLQEAVLWAFGPAREDFTDNLNIRRSPSGPQIVTAMQPVLDALLPEYAKMGLQVTSVDPSLRIQGLPAARVTWTRSIQTRQGLVLEMRGRQVFVATDLELWILSFSTTPERERQLAPVFERVAQSFQPK